MSKKLKMVIEYECTVDIVFSDCSEGKASLGIIGSSRAGRPPKNILKGSDKTGHCADLRNGSR